MIINLWEWAYCSSSLAASFLDIVLELALSFTAFSQSMAPTKKIFKPNWPKKEKNKENRYEKLYP